MNNFVSTHCSVIRKWIISSTGHRGGNCICLPNIVNAICARVYQNPIHKKKHLTHEANISVQSVRRILCSDLHLGAYWRHVSHLLNAGLNEKQLLWCKRQLKQFSKNRHCNILFTNEYIFWVKELTQKSDNVLKKNCHKALKWVTWFLRGHHPTPVMIWWGFHTTVQQKLIFVKPEWRLIWKCTVAWWTWSLRHSMIPFLKAVTGIFNKIQHWGTKLGECKPAWPNMF